MILPFPAAKNHLRSSLVGLALLTASQAPAALVYYELTLTTDSAYTAFGGGNAGDIFTGLFWFDDTSPTSPGPPTNPEITILPSAYIFYNISIGPASFSSSQPGSLVDNALGFESGVLADVFFKVNNPAGDALEVTTAFAGGISRWTATETGSGATAGGATFPDSVRFEPTTMPEPTTAGLAALGVIVLLRRRR